MQSIIFLKNSFIITIFIFFGCDSQNKSVKDFEKKKTINNSAIIRKDSLEKQEWYEFVYSRECKIISAPSNVDSLTLIAMDENTPEVIARSKYFFWQKQQIIHSGEFDLLFKLKNKNIFVFGCIGNRNILLEKYKLENRKLTKFQASEIFSLNNLKKSNICLEIVDARQLNDLEKIQIELHNTCQDLYFDTIVSF